MNSRHLQDEHPGNSRQVSIRGPSFVEVALAKALKFFAIFLLWGYLWGVPGTLLAVPILATFKIFCDRIGPLKRIGFFLGRP
jgi:hypothetical protein